MTERGCSATPNVRFVVLAMNESEQSGNAPGTDAEGRTPQVMQSGAGNVDKIRDILFGSQIKNYETRFHRLEETLARESADLKETMRRRFESLEAAQHVAEVEALLARCQEDPACP